MKKGNRISNTWAIWVQLQNRLAKRHMLGGRWNLRMRLVRALRDPISHKFVHRGVL